MGRGTTATGTFELTSFQPEAIDEAPGAALGRVVITKVFTGDLAGESTVHMSSVMDVEGAPAAYVAVERFTGELAGRKGSFVFLHCAPGTAGEELAIRVVAGTGTDELAGITGSLDITRTEDGGHTYVLDYILG
ncbi:hypothetical protein B4N89_31735 [Embleya scabrispora]|uniref:DUF3224 domain-containing protein n=1 Tax=Embleya scabrispora TaxID=159449 RepID=A0A1T3NPP2_9ACTN|nr:DUF3224 domain-containing protein [Embleya scabrispora]OPC78734.1 hypothetical protein B4N89_31735 [Embleya scabrispora]